MFRYRLVDNFAYAKVSLAIGQASVEAKLPPHPLFAQVKSIQLNNDELNLKLLSLLEKGEVQITPQKSSQFVRRCKQAFNLQLELNITEIGISLIFGSSDQDAKTLDILQFGDLLLVIKSAFDKTGVKLHAKVIRKIKNYVVNSKRRQSEKEVLQNYIKSYKNSEKIEDLQENEQKQQIQEKKVSKIKKQPTRIVKKQSDKLELKPDTKKQNNQDIKSEDSSERIEEELAEQIKPRTNYRKGKRQNRQFDTGQEPQGQEEKRNGRGRDHRMRQSRGKGGRSNDRFGGTSMSKQKKYDPKIMLGISGDTQAGWRQRYRPPRVPAGNTLTVDQANNYKQQPNLNFQPKYSSSSSSKPTYSKPDRQQRVSSQKQVNVTKQKEQTKVAEKIGVKKPTQPVSSGNPDLLFTYPKDGQEFDFNQIKSSFRMFINGSFWVNFNGGTLEIKKGEKGYRRQSKIDVIKNGFMAEGLTIRLGGSSNIEDGGDAMGDPTIQDFTNTTSQFFHVVTLQIFKYGSSNSVPVANNEAKQQQSSQLKNPQPTKQSSPTKVQNLVTQQKKAKKEEKKIEKTPTKKEKHADNQQDWQDDGEVQKQQEIPEIQPKEIPIQKSKKEKKTHQNRSKAHEPKHNKNNLQVQQRQSKDPRSRSKSKESRGRSKNSRSRQKIEDNSPRNKEKLDPEILLGIKGDSQLGWRERNRPTHSHGPARNNPSGDDGENQEQDQAQKETKHKPTVHHANHAQQKKQTGVQSQSANIAKVDQKLVFAYPKDGANFDFNRVKSGFRMLVNNRFWIHYENGKLEIRVGEKGYSRETNLDVIDNGFMAHGLTISLEGISNIEDGGDTFGDPNIEDFTQNNSQFFSIKSLQIFTL